MSSAPSDSRMPAMPPAERPWGRTESAGNRSAWASEEMSTMSSPGADSAAPTTVSPSPRGMRSQSRRVGGPCTATRLTTPCRVARAITAGGSLTSARPTTRSSACRSRSAPNGAPPPREGAWADGGRIGISTTGRRRARPMLVMTATSPRPVAMVEATMTSCAARGPSRATSGPDVRAMSPVPERRTRQGESVISKDAGEAAVMDADSSSRMVRRGVA